MKISTNEEKAQEVLEKSIKHYEENVITGKEAANGDHCALCKEYIKFDCKGCLVFIKTGKIGCEDTPWEKFDDHYRNDHDMYIKGDNFPRVVCPECERLARDELRFLKSLRKKNEVFYKVGDIFNREGENEAYAMLCLCESYHTVGLMIIQENSELKGHLTSEPPQRVSNISKVPENIVKGLTVLTIKKMETK